MSSSAPTRSAEAERFSRDLRRAAAGDRRAIDRIVEEFRPALVRSARQRGASDPDSMANTVMYETLRGLPRFRGRDRRAFRAYLYQVLSRRLVDEFRRSKPGTCSVPSDPSGELLAGMADVDASQFDEQVADRQLVAGALDTLTADQREVVQMRLLDGMSIKETAARTGRSEMAVKAMQRRALNSMRAVLAVAVLVAVGFGLWAVQSRAGEVTITDVDPAGQDRSDSGIDESGVEPEDEELGLEADRQQIVVQGVDRAQQPAPTATPTTSSTAESPTSPPPTASVAVPTTQGGGSSTAPTQSGGLEPPTFAVAPLPRNLTNSPCSVITDGTPAPGEVAHIAYDFSGPYVLLRGTSIDVLRGDGTSALLRSSNDPLSVGDGRTFPFRLSGNMFWEGELAVSTILAAGELTTRCFIDGGTQRPPCVVPLKGGDPEVGDVLTVRYRAWGNWRTLAEQPTGIVTRAGRSAMIGDVVPTFTSGLEAQFIVTNDMLRDGGFEVRNSFGDPQTWAACEIRP